MLITLLEELESGKTRIDHEKLYSKYFDIQSTPIRGAKVNAKQEVIDEMKRNYGYFALISNEIKDPIEALEIYRNKDLIEKAFGNLKERLNLRRTLVSSELSLDGKLFVEFVALIYLSYKGSLPAAEQRGIYKQLASLAIKASFVPNISSYILFLYLAPLHNHLLLTHSHVSQQYL